MDKVRFLMSDTGAQITEACREALEQGRTLGAAAPGASSPKKTPKPTTLPARPNPITQPEPDPHGLL